MRGDAIGLAHHLGVEAGLEGHDLAVQLVGGAAVDIRNSARSSCDVGARLADRLAGVARLGLRQVPPRAREISAAIFVSSRPRSVAVIAPQAPS